MKAYPSVFVTEELVKDCAFAPLANISNRTTPVLIAPAEALGSKSSSNSEKKKKFNLSSLVKENYFREAPFRTNSSILSEENRAFLQFKTKSLSCIVANNGQQYYDNWTINYCAGGEDIEGILVLNKGVLTFNMTRNVEAMNSSNKKSSRNPKDGVKILADLEIVINGQDIIKSEIMTVPIPCIKRKHVSDNVHILQITLCNHGERAIDEHLDVTINDMRLKRLPYACVYFNIKPMCGDTAMDKESVEILSQLHKKIQTIIQFNQDQHVPEPLKLVKKDGEFSQKTNLPYFEFLTASFSSEHAQLMRSSSNLMKKTILAQISQLKESSSPLVKGIMTPVMKKQRKLITPEITHESGIVTNHQFSQIISCMPDLYQMMEWKLLYSTVQNGTSFNNLMRRGGSANPFIIISKDFEGNVLGAYGSANLRYSQDYYGTPETFLFTFKKTEEIQDFQWSKKNDMFIFANEEGIMFGTGPFYGLWIGSDLTRGRTYPCATFDSESLCDSTDFEISRLEVWGVMNSFSTYI